METSTYQAQLTARSNVAPAGRRRPSKCPHCATAGRFDDAMLEASREVSNHRFVATLPARICSACGQSIYEADAEQRFALAIARCIADSGLSTGDAFRFMRRAVGMRATELADLLDLAPETISRWETGKRGVDRGALAVVGNLVRDTIAGRTTTLDGLRSLRTPRALDATVAVEP